MNRFKGKKKGKDDASASRPSLESESSFSLFRRSGKKNSDEEPKKDLDLATALPSNDDFRTSLLMNGLSARFSMLREQDDPSSKIGKASDDSVLFPKRQSRLADFGFSSGLGDISEVESLNPPSFLRTDTSTSNISNDSSIMTRSRPTESNVLFGGRQKIFKISAGISSTKNLGDGMGGRALYDDDVAMSAFQKWRVTEKEKEYDFRFSNDEDDCTKDSSLEGRTMEETSFITRSESPLLNGYNKKRETSSTTSSTPSNGRNSTAATSVISQPTAFSKENHSQQTTTPSASSTAALERHGTRTRKLYEQGLTQDLQERQNSVLARVDTLARRPGGARTPDTGANSPSPTMQTFSDRFVAFGNERRTVLSKGSAPNLRMMSPPATGSLNGKMDMSVRIPNTTDSNGAFISTPPLSPPVSDSGTGEQIKLAIQPSDLGKATSMNMFQKPTSPYDDSKYTERQRQLQQGRETPVQMSRTDSTTSSSNFRSRSAASLRKQDHDSKTTHSSKKVETSGHSEHTSLDFFDETVESPILKEHSTSPVSPHIRLERPSDQDHPAFRQSTVQVPLSFSPKADEQQSPRIEGFSFLKLDSQSDALSDSPTLGPNVGLSGMVRQHLRSESDVSSIYAPSSAPQSPQNQTDFVQPVNTWIEPDWNPLQGHDDQRSSSAKAEMSVTQTDESKDTLQKMNSFLDSPTVPDEEDEFASQLADARRRVREKLTSFVETDNSPSYPLTAHEDSEDGELPDLPTRVNPLGILRGKGSRGSLIDRGRDAAPKPSRAMSGQNDKEARVGEEEDAQSGLWSFRQSRRELQKRKELDTMARHSPHYGELTESPIMENPGPLVSGGVRGSTHNPSGDRQPPPPRSRSRAVRSRSGSENSAESSSRSQSRGPAEFMEHFDSSATRKTTSTSPQGLPGTDMRPSPFVPPMGQPHDSNRSVGSRLPGINTSGNWKSQTGRSEQMSAGSSPLSGPADTRRAPLQPHSAPKSTPSTPSVPPSRRPSMPTNAQLRANSSTLSDSMKRVINKKDISEPTFVMSTSRVPTTSLPAAVTEAREARSRSGSTEGYGAPPPVPPVNPRRKREGSRTRNAINGLLGGNKAEESESISLSKSTPHLPLAPSVARSAETSLERQNSAFAESEDIKNARQRLRKVNSDARINSHPNRVSPPQTAVGPPAGRTAVRSGVRGPSPNMPGGMF